MPPFFSKGGIKRILFKFYGNFYCLYICSYHESDFFKGVPN